MSIDKSKPWYPQDHPLEDSLKLCKESASKNLFTPDAERKLHKEITEDHYLRSHGPAAIFVDLRRQLENALHGQQIQQMPLRDQPQKRKRLDEEGRITVDAERFMGTVDVVIASAIHKLTSSSTVPPFYISDYAIPVFKDTDEGTFLMEDSRPCIAVLEKYWAMVSTEKSTS